MKKFNVENEKAKIYLSCLWSACIVKRKANSVKTSHLLHTSYAVLIGIIPIYKLF